MPSQRAPRFMSILSLGFLLALAGCLQSVGDDFTEVNSEPVAIAQNPTLTPTTTILQPTADITAEVTAQVAPETTAEATPETTPEALAVVGTPSETPTPTLTLTPTLTETPTLTPSVTQDLGVVVATSTPSLTPTLTHTPTATLTFTVTPSLTPTLTWTIVPQEPTLLPTATQPTIITPDQPSVVQFPTATPLPVTATPTPAEVAQQATAAPDEGDAAPEADDDDVCTYTVQRGDNLFRIALDNDLSLGALLRANGLTENSIIQPGQVLILPTTECLAAEATPTSTPLPDATEAPDATPEETLEAPEDGIIHVVRADETLWSLSLRYGVSITELIEANDQLENPQVIFPGDEVIIPGIDPD